MDRTDAVVAISGMVAGVLVMCAIVWGLVEHAKARYRQKGSDPLLAGDVAALRDRVDLLQQQLVEAQERIEFAERLLAQGRPDNALPRVK